MSEYPLEERRRSERYPIDEELRYRVLEPRGKYRMGNGRTLDMSSSGVRFHTEESLRIGERLEMAMNWPASLDGNCRLKLVAFGRIVRLCEEGAVMQIEKYEFRTRGTNGLL